MRPGSTRAPARRATAKAAAIGVAAAFAGACAQPTSEEASAYLLLDREARDALTVVHDGWEGTPVLPVALDAELPVTLRSRAGTRTIALRPGAFLHVTGADGSLTWLEVGTEVFDDRLLVRGTARAAAELAEQLGASARERGDGLWSFEAPDLLDRGSFLEPPWGIAEVLPDLVARLDVAALGSDAARITASDAIGAEGAREAAGRAGLAEAGLVGAYAAGDRILWLDAAGGFSLEDRCTGEVERAGRYYAASDGVVLRAGAEPAIALERSPRGLVLPNGEKLALLGLEPEAKHDVGTEEATR